MLTIATAVRRRQAQAHNDRAWLAWNIAALTRVQKMPPLKSLQIDPSADAPRRQTWQEQLAIARALWGRASGR